MYIISLSLYIYIYIDNKDKHGKTDLEDDLCPDVLWSTKVVFLIHPPILMGDTMVLHMVKPTMILRTTKRWGI